MKFSLVLPLLVLSNRPKMRTNPIAVWHSLMGILVSASSPAVGGEALSMYTSNLAKGGVVPPQVIIGDQHAQIL